MTHVRVGVVNLMPKAESYELMLRRALARASDDTTPQYELRFIRVTHHRYGSSDVEHLRTDYRSYEQTIAQGALQGLIVTGAPVEQLAFEDVLYWSELCTILAHARANVPRTLGLCWGAMALAKLEGVEKTVYPQKLFGLYPIRTCATDEAQTDDYCAQSRHSGFETASLRCALASARLRSVAFGEAVGHTVLETADGRCRMHLGHPEYEVARLVYEYERDRDAGRDDVAAPVAVANAAAVTGHAHHSAAFFGAWLRSMITP